MKRCPKCGEHKPHDAYQRNARKADGLNVYCAACMREYKYQSRYGISTTEFEQMVADRGGACDICKGQSDRRLHVDHDHKTGAVRGILCGNCNRGLGKFQDSPDLLCAAAKYLETNT